MNRTAIKNYLVIHKEPIAFTSILDKTPKLGYKITSHAVNFAVRVGSSREVRVATDDILDLNNKDVYFAVVIEYCIGGDNKFDIDTIVTNGSEYYLAVRSLGPTKLILNTYLKQTIDSLIDDFTRNLK